MATEQELYDKIVKLTRHYDKKNKCLGTELLIATQNFELISKVIIKQHLLPLECRLVLANYSNKNTAFWENLKKKLDPTYHKYIAEWIPRTILEQYQLTKDAFCQLATEKAQEVWSNFPTLKTSLAKCKSASMSRRCIEGSHIENEIGWELKFLALYEGPAESYQRDKWTAIAYHPDFAIKFYHEYGHDYIDLTWMEKIY